MSRARHVLVVGGGANAEHEVSLASAAAVRGALLAGGHLVTGLTIRRDGSWQTSGGTSLELSAAIARLRAADVVFPALHGDGLEDGTFAGLLEVLGVPYVGSGVRAGALGMDKWAAKLISERLGIATAPAVLVEGSTGRSDARSLACPVIVKPVASGSSFGAARIERAEEIPAAITAAQRIDERVLVEEFIAGREIDLAVMRRPGGDLSIALPLEIVKPEDAIFDTALKYDAAPEFLVPAPLDPGTLAQLRRAAAAIYEALGCDGVARVDFFVRGEEIIFNEINTMPGMTEHSQVPRMFGGAGVSFPELTALLVERAYLDS